MAFGEGSCLCTPGPVVNGHETWIIDSECPQHGNPGGN